jgi:uncharacterized membrane protein
MLSGQVASVRRWQAGMLQVIINLQLIGEIINSNNFNGQVSPMTLFGANMGNTLANQGSGSLSTFVAIGSISLGL